VTEPQAYFRESEDGGFYANDPARGPWSPDHCHAGPVIGLLVRAAEAAVGSGKMLTRLTSDVLRPLPLTGLWITTNIIRNTRTLATTRIEVHDADGTRCIFATSMHLARQALNDIPTAPVDPLRFEHAERGSFPLNQSLHNLPSFSRFVDVAFPSGQSNGTGPKTIWMRAPNLLEGETQSPIQSICPLADCGNGISFNARPAEIGFMNTDLTLQIHREPESEWMAAESVSHWHNTGIGMSHSVLHDTKGPVGVALQTLVLRPVEVQ
jgi:acyl-Coa thioesterase superfamily protein/acyl-CoA thioesterase superfamily protein